MIKFGSVSRISETEGDILLLAEAKYDESILGSSSKWIAAPYLAVPFEYANSYSDNSSNCASAYISHVRSSAVAMSVLKSIVELSEHNKTCIISCYNFNVSESHLATLLNLIEELFVNEAPDMQMIGG